MFPIKALIKQVSAHDFLLYIIFLIDDSLNNSDVVDSANEKLHGRALFERQQHFSLLIRSLNRFGLSSRRAHKIDSEKLTVETLTQVAPDIKNLLLAGDTVFIFKFKAHFLLNFI